VAFGKLIPVTSMGLGKVLWLASYHQPFLVDPGTLPQIRADEATLDAQGLGEWHRHDVNQALTHIATQRIAARPGVYVVGCMQRIVRLWMSAVAPGVPRVVLYLFLLLQAITLTAMAAGLWIARKSLDPVLAGSAVIVLYYWLLFVPFSHEARSTLPARGFAFILAGCAVARLLHRVTDTEPESGTVR
ncbi:MAG: hypothetical protein JWM53_1954, partial [bacterium]|nr:hypothetical protein [bacterium]